LNTTKTVAIIGGGPAGLTAAYELLKLKGYHPIVLEKSEYLGGISRTILHNGNRMDIGGHRFFSKSDVVMDWWLNILPIQKLDETEITLSYQNKKHTLTQPHKYQTLDDKDAVMLVRRRKSRIYYKRTFFDYPITLSFDTIKKLGFWHTIKIGFSYIWAILFPIKNEQNLEQFFINRFGRVLYLTFFKSYTEKVWGVSCLDINADWGAQRIKGLSITKTITHFLKKIMGGKGQTDLKQKNKETSLIEYFLYPKYGPGQMWETVATKIQDMGGEIIMSASVVQIDNEDDQIKGVTYKTQDGESHYVKADYVISTMAIKDLLQGFKQTVPAEVLAVSDNLMYRDFITVGILANQLKTGPLEDNWIYIQEPDVMVGRLQIFNNWSPFLVQDGSKTWIGMEYFCFEGDELWNKTENEMKAFAIEELVKINLLNEADVIDSVVIKMPKTYPAYFGVYNQFDTVKNYLNTFTNLFPVGRNGMHKYNNQDHSMLTAMQAVKNIASGNTQKDNIWDINTEQEYHEEK